MVAGPFTMAAGDTQEVVVAEIAAIGSNNIASVGLLKDYDKVAQDAYDQFFVLPSAPRIPNTVGVGLDKQVILNWGFDLARVEETEAHNKELFTFQGYNIYQLPNPTATKEDAVRIATFDLIDGIKAVRDRTVDPVSGEEEIVVQQFGGDYGIKRSFSINKNYITNTPLSNGSRYYFAVTAYAIYNQSPDPDPVQVPNNLENTFNVLTVVPQSPDPGVTYGQEPGSEIEWEHTTGSADGVPFITVVDPSATTGNEYELYFTSRQEIRDENGDWVPSSTVDRGMRPNDPDTLTGTTIDIAGLYGPVGGTIDLAFHLDIVHHDFGWGDGVRLKFPGGVNIVSAAPFEAGGGTVTPVIETYGTDSTIVNMGNVNHEYTQNGVFHEGGEDWVITVASFTPPMAVDWIVFDDGWPDPAEALDAFGTTTVQEVGYAARTALYWNVRDVDANTLKIENQGIVDGVNLFPKRDDLPTGFGTNTAQVADGFEIGVLGSYDSPIVPLGYEITPIDPDNPSLIGTGSAASGTRTIFANYTLYGLPTSWVADGFGTINGEWIFGSKNIDTLQQDLELRYTGILDTVVNGTDTLIVVESGGQMATIFSTVPGLGLASHPLNPSPGTNAPFLIRIPFEVWNKDENRQVNVAFRDREQLLVPGTPFYAWNPNNRNYMCVVNSNYDPTKIIPISFDATDPENVFATWIIVIYSTRLVPGDVVTISYANPFQIGADTYRFSTERYTFSNELAKDQIHEINVFPNPYYGVNSQEINKYERFVTINHLPEQATIRIFNLAGQLIRTINKNDPGQFQRWDLLTEFGLPVASGLYVIYVDMPDLGVTKILKAAIIQEQQILDRF
jgi:hypothetical protein